MGHGDGEEEEAREFQSCLKVKSQGEKEGMENGLLFQDGMYDRCVESCECFA